MTGRVLRGQRVVSKELGQVSNPIGQLDDEIAFFDLGREIKDVVQSAHVVGTVHADVLARVCPSARAGCSPTELTDPTLWPCGRFGEAGAALASMRHIVCSPRYATPSPGLQRTVLSCARG